MTVSKSHINYDNNSDFKKLSIKAQNILNTITLNDLIIINNSEESRSLKRS